MGFFINIIFLVMLGYTLIYNKLYIATVLLVILWFIVIKLFKSFKMQNNTKKKKLF